MGLISMKTIILFLLFSLASLDARTGNDFSGCKAKGKNLFGRVMIVNAGEDLRVMKVAHAPDIRVQVVNMAPNRCGQWMFVESLPDLKIKIVDSQPDIHIQFVNFSPGLN